MLHPGWRHATALVPTSGCSAGAAPPAAQAADVVAATALAAADRHGDVSASATASAAERTRSATTAAPHTNAAGFPAALRGALPGGAAPPVAAGWDIVAWASPAPAPTGNSPAALRPVVGGAEVAGWAGTATECHIAACPAPLAVVATRAPSETTATAPTAASNRASFKPGALLGVATQAADSGKDDTGAAAAAPQSRCLCAAFPVGIAAGDGAARQGAWSVSARTHTSTGAAVLAEAVGEEPRTAGCAADTGAACRGAGCRAAETAPASAVVAVREAAATPAAGTGNRGFSTLAAMEAAAAGAATIPRQPLSRQASMSGMSLWPHAFCSQTA